jgi:BlaI family transcriptional regulator, penicillinase repressor
MKRADASPDTPSDGPRVLVLGRLEALVMECLWQSENGASVREVALRLNGPWAYTTLMTTLDRLFKKGLANRERKGRAFVYRARLSRAELGVRALTTAVSDIDAATETRDLALAALVDALESRDPDWLDSLDRLVRERKRALRQARKAEERG